MSYENCWQLILGELRQRVDNVHTAILLMHSDPKFLFSDDMDYQELKRRLNVAEDYLFQAKQVRVYLEKTAKGENDG